ncbi:MAG: hypothetical protein ACRDN1_06805, partial [Trebonia sp.]
ADFQRAGHLAPVPLPGGAAAIRQPWRMAAAYLDAASSDLAGLGVALPDAGDLGVARRNADRWDTIVAMARRRVNAPLTSSAGRLFDAAAALLGVRDEITYEGQAAIELEQLADPAEPLAYRAGLTTPDDPLTTPAARKPPPPSAAAPTDRAGSAAAAVDGAGSAAVPPNRAGVAALPPDRAGIAAAATDQSGIAAATDRAGIAASGPFRASGADLIAAVAADLTAGVPRERIAARFHNGVAALIVDGCVYLRERHGLATVALSGGVFQNLLLLGRTVAGLEAQGFTVLTHSRVPCNDGGISLGQAVIAATRTRPPS